MPLFRPAIVVAEELELRRLKQAVAEQARDPARCPGRAARPAGTPTREAGGARPRRRPPPSARGERRPPRTPSRCPAGGPTEEGSAADGRRRARGRRRRAPGSEESAPRAPAASQCIGRPRAEQRERQDRAGCRQEFGALPRVSPSGDGGQRAGHRRESGEREDRRNAALGERDHEKRPDRDGMRRDRGNPKARARRPREASASAPASSSRRRARRRARAVSRPEAFPRRRRPGEGPPGSPGGGRPCGDRSRARRRGRAPARGQASRAGWPRWPPPPRIRVRIPAPAASRVFRSDLTKLARRTVGGPEVSLRARRETARRPSCRGRRVRRRPRRRRRERARDAGS